MISITEQLNITTLPMVEITKIREGETKKATVQLKEQARVQEEKTQQETLVTKQKQVQAQRNVRTGQNKFTTIIPPPPPYSSMA